MRIQQKVIYVYVSLYFSMFKPILDCVLVYTNELFTADGSKVTMFRIPIDLSLVCTLISLYYYL